MPFYDSEAIERARQVDLLTYLQTCEPQELVHVSAARRRTSMKVLRMVRNLVLLVLGVILCAILALAFLGWQMYTQALEATPLDQKVKQVRAQESYTTFAELPETYVDAVIAAEDHRFYQHNGIDVIAIGRVSSSSSSSAMRSRSSAMSKGARRAPQEIRIDFKVLPETSCQGLFNQIHRKATKKCQEALSCS